MADSESAPSGSDTPPDHTSEPGGSGGDTSPDQQAEAEKWKALARKHEQQAKANAEAAKKLAEIEEGNKTELQKLTDARTAAEKEAAEAKASALRLDVAMDKAPDGMPISQVRKLAKRLQGVTREDLEADAAELFAEFAPGDGDGKPTPPGRKPTEHLRGGKNPETDPDIDPEKLAEAIYSRGRI